MRSLRLQQLEPTAHRRHPRPCRAASPRNGLLRYRRAADDDRLHAHGMRWSRRRGGSAARNFRPCIAWLGLHRESRNPRPGRAAFPVREEAHDNALVATAASRLAKRTSPLYELWLAAVGSNGAHGGRKFCVGIRLAVRNCETGPSRFCENTGKNAGDDAATGKTEHRRKRSSIGFDGSLCRRAARTPEEGDPEALTKHAAAKAADSAKIAPAAGARKRKAHCGNVGLKKIAWNVSHSDAKPLSGGSAEIAAEPIRKATAVLGIL